MEQVKKKIRFHDREPDDIKRKINTMADAYVYSEPFPLEYGAIEDLDYDSIPPEIWRSIHTVQSYDVGMLGASSHFKMRVDGAPEDAHLEIADYKNNDHIQCRSRSLPTTSKHYAAVKKWVDETLERAELVADFKKHVYEVFYWCSTPGQVKTMYPAMVELLPDRHIEALSKSVRATRWPNNWNPDRQAEFKRESDRFANMIVLLKMVYQTSKDRKTGEFRVTIG